MLFYESGKWNLHKYKMAYTERGAELERYVTDTGYWDNFERKWEHFEITKYEDVDCTDEQLKRYEEIKNMPEDFGNVYSEYIKGGNLNTDDLPKNHLFNILKLEKEKSNLEDSLMELNMFVAGVLNV